MRFFTPTLYLGSITDVSLKILKKIGVKGLILDIDDTLAPSRVTYLSDDVIKWSNDLKKSGIKIMVASNNYRVGRVRSIADGLGAECLFFVCKPLPFGIRFAVKRLGLNFNEVALIGDQIFTDILASNFAGVKSILLNPLSAPKSWQMKLKRKLEKPIKRGIKVIDNF